MQLCLIYATYKLFASQIGLTLAVILGWCVSIPLAWSGTLCLHYIPKGTVDINAYITVAFIVKLYLWLQPVLKQ